MNKKKNVPLIVDPDNDICHVLMNQIIVTNYSHPTVSEE